MTPTRLITNLFLSLLHYIRRTVELLVNLLLSFKLTIMYKNQIMSFFFRMRWIILILVIIGWLYLGCGTAYAMDDEFIKELESLKDFDPNEYDIETFFDDIPEPSDPPRDEAGGSNVGDRGKAEAGGGENVGAEAGEKASTSRPKRKLSQKETLRRLLKHINFFINTYGFDMAKDIVLSPPYVTDEDRAIYETIFNHLKNKKKD